MRSFTTFLQAKNEITRDLAELGTMRFRGYQSKNVAEMSGEEINALTTTELINYDYTVLDPQLEHLSPVQPWADAEWAERVMGIMGKGVNPGEAWELRADVWSPLLETNVERPFGKFSYTYSERFQDAWVGEILNELKRNPDSRQAYISVWDPYLDGPRLGKRRVPCSLGYDLLVVGAGQWTGRQLQITYYMRSSDFHTHWDNDVWLACQLQKFAAEWIGCGVGRFTQCVKNLHTYKKSVQDVF